MNIEGAAVTSSIKKSLMNSIQTGIDLSTEDKQKLVNGETVEVELEEKNYKVNYILVDDEYLTFKKR